MENPIKEIVLILLMVSQFVLFGITKEIEIPYLILLTYVLVNVLWPNQPCRDKPTINGELVK